MGGYVSGSASFIDLIRSYAAGFIFTTALAPALVAGALSSIEYLKSSNQERSLQQLHTRLLKQKLWDASIPVIPNPSHIVPVLVGDAELCRRASDMLLADHNIYVQSINYPTVPRGEERLRITPTPGHSIDMANKLVHALDQIWTTLDLRRQNDWLIHQTGDRLRIGESMEPLMVH